MTERRALYLRFSPEQFLRLQNDARTAGISPQDLLKARYFSRKPLSPVFDADDTKSILSRLNEVATDVNRIALALSASPFEGMFDAIGKIEGVLFEVRTFVLMKFPEKIREQIDGLRQNQIPQKL